MMATTSRAPKFELWRPWLKAIHAGDCLAIRNLLRLHPWLVVVFPGSHDCDFKRAKNILQSPVNGMKDWEGCSALHVAVRQGCEALVEDIFDVFRQDGKEGLLSSRSLGNTGLPSPAATGFDLEKSGTRTADEDDSSEHAQIMKKSTIKEAQLFENLLLAEEPSSGLDALAIAVINGQEQMVRQLVTAFSELDSNPYELPPSGDSSVTASPPEDKESTTAQLHVQKITKEVLEQMMDTEPQLAEKEFSLLHEFNFLPWPLYLFHAACSKTSVIMDLCRRKIIQQAVEMGPEYVNSLFKVLDGQGRTPLHVAVAAGPEIGIVSDILQTLPEGEEYAKSLNATDGAGRTPLHCAIGKEQADKEVELLLKDERTDVNAVFFYNTKILRHFDIEKLCTRHGFRTCSTGSILKNIHKSTVLHLAAWSPWPKVVKAVQILLKDPRLNLSQTCNINIPSKHDRTDPSPFGWNKDGDFYLTPLQLATLLENAPLLQLLASDDRAYDSGRLNNDMTYDDLRATVDRELSSLISEFPESNFSENKKGGKASFKQKKIETWVKFMNTSALHYAAIIGNPAAVRIIQNSKKFDPLVEDLDGNNALHYAAYARESIPSIVPHLLDVPSCSSPLLPRVRPLPEGAADPATGESRRQGCINLLLQAGIDIWKANKEGNIADPGMRASPDACSWWYDKLARETLETKQSLNAAANAVSVTAALVATASYVGPMQPPLGYLSGADGSAEQIQVQLSAVRMFIVCDTVAFYVALCAIMLALIPSLPMPQESMLDELVSTRRSVTLAVAFLILSITAIIFAFGSASMAVIPNDGGSWNYRGLTMGPIIVGSTFCALFMYMICLRLIRLVLHKNFWFRRNYRRITLF